MLAAADRDELGGNVEPDAVEAGAREQRGKRARAAAEIDHPRAAWKAGQLDERVDEARARLRREHVVVVRGGVAVEERDLLLLVLRFILHQGRHFRIGSDLSCPGIARRKTRVNALMTRASTEKSASSKRMDGSYITARAAAPSRAPAAGPRPACAPRRARRRTRRCGRSASLRPCAAGRCRGCRGC